MAVEAAPLSVTCPSDHTSSVEGHPGGRRGGLLVLHCGRRSPLQAKGGRNQAQDAPEDGLNRGTSAPQNVQRAGSLIPMDRGTWWPGR